jgi:hypothetical protein
MKKRVVLALKNRPSLKVELPDNPANVDIGRQVSNNRKARAYFAADKQYRQAGILMVHVLVDNVMCYVDTDTLAVKGFCPRTKREKAAIAEMEACLLSMTRVARNRKQKYFNRMRAIYAKEMLWLAITGVVNTGDTGKGVDRGLKNIHNYALEATWKVGTEPGTIE